MNRLSDQVAREGGRDCAAVAGMMGPAASVAQPSSDPVGSTTAAGSHLGAVGQPVASFAAATGPTRDLPTHLGTLTYDEIISGGANCEPVNREMCMSEEEFAQRMGCSKAEWGDVKQWKKDAKKKELGLF